MPEHPFDAELSALWQRRMDSGFSEAHWRRLYTLIVAIASKSKKAQQLLRMLADSERNYLDRYFDEKVWRPVSGDDAYRPRDGHPKRSGTNVGLQKVGFQNYLLDRLDEAERKREDIYDRDETLYDWLRYQGRAQPVDAELDHDATPLQMTAAAEGGIRDSAHAFLKGRTHFEVALIARVLPGDSALNAVALQFGVAASSAKLKAEELGIQLARKKNEIADLEQWNGSLIAAWIAGVIKTLNSKKMATIAVENTGEILAGLKILMDCALYEDRARIGGQSEAS